MSSLSLSVPADLMALNALTSPLGSFLPTPRASTVRPNGVPTTPPATVAWHSRHPSAPAALGNRDMPHALCSVAGNSADAITREGPSTMTTPTKLDSARTAGFEDIDLLTITSRRAPAQAKSARAHARYRLRGSDTHCPIAARLAARSATPETTRERKKQVDRSRRRCEPHP